VTAGYSGTPSPQKLGIKPGHRVALVGAPADFEVTLGLVPGDVTLRRDGRVAADVVVAFATEAADLERRFPVLARRIPRDGGLWIAWPKRASGVATDLNENVIRGIGLAAGLVDNKVCAIDETWSGIRFVFRRKDRPPRKA
jgi:hypothetical protein